jgi:large subunit ribosomal protein L13
MIVDAEGAILGRLAARIAKELLKGESIIVINSERVIITGNPDAVMRRYFTKRERGDPNKGPFYPRQPDKILKRAIRGMLPYKKEKGKKALRKLKVFIGNSNNLKGEKISKTEEDIRCKYLTVKGLCKKLGAKLD